MMKFDIIESQYAFWLDTHLDNLLFGFGHYDINVLKENDKTKSFCSQFSFEYEGIRNALCGKELQEHFNQNELL
ncbi:Hypothetical protein EHI5A_105020 [Entamoeba histolytica KU27]|uniref:Uncharacterized protein n=1 Tax=Entamoeba histolytica KU27 TaxID=885311 RepID=M2QHB7_ENTHI|nr:Hypothetical protein EHI5A_105020 [Entamoeba histolytica KU27]